MWSARSIGAPTPDKLDTLITFGREVSNLVTYIEAANLQAHLSNPMLLAEMVSKLPPNLRLDWELHSKSTGDVSLKAFSEYVATIRSAACHVSLPSEQFQLEDSQMRKKDKQSFVNAHISDETEKSTATNFTDVKPCPVCYQTGHKIRDCERFKDSSVEERWKTVEQRNLCKRCLVGHGKWPCRTKQPCGLNGCTEQHHRLLHADRAVVKETDSDSSALVSTHHCLVHSTFFKILTATLHGAGKTIKTYAFLDDGSSHTLLDQDLADELGLDGEPVPLCLQWTANVTRKEPNSRKVSLSISNVNGGSRYDMSDVRTVRKLDLPRQTMDYEQLSGQFPHLLGLSIGSYRDAVPRILIGANNANLILALARRERRVGEPVATKTRLGWTVFGGARTATEPANLMVHKCGCSQDDALQELVKDYFAMDNCGVNSPTMESAEDQRARKILQETTKRTPSGKFETGLLWLSDAIEMPDSYHMAARRLKCLERSLNKDPELKKKVDASIEEYLQLGYVHVAIDDELRTTNPKRIWYLSLGVVRNPRKPDKVRVVWDAAATVNGVSLNSLLLPGPDLLTPLLTVLCQFRQRQYAVSADIRQMFHQLRIRQEDRQVQRFLYRSDSQSEPTIDILDVATFGATCSPCSAQYAKNLNASEHHSKFPDAADAVVNNTYVDDYLDSRDTIEEAVQLSLDVRAINLKAGFELRNWQSNSKEILRRVGDKCIEPDKSFAVEKATPMERVLGMSWKTEEDVFVFSAQFREDLLPLLPGDIVPTKHQVLRIVMSYFDPLGIITNYTIHGRILLQDIWRSNIKWDDPITDGDFANWRRWVLLAPQLGNVMIPRCYFPGYGIGSYDSLQLHVFVDAGDQAYGAVAYFRIVDRGIPRCALVAAKAKVTPLKPVSTPRSELNAGVIGVRLMKTIEKHHSLAIKKRFLWTDSTTVLSWLRADPRKY
ncbi:uncharacterized protein LOC109426557 isoform X1 [Aedes albopictus]|uniref:Peptidase aspartic putative domain-containing protein n=1 Tax=Aedes albopictus TaxID=7160 RepID=A0ABM1YZW1_AEDAL